MCSKKLTRRLRSSDRSSRPPSAQYLQTQRDREGRKIGKHCFSRRSFLATSKCAIPTNATRSGRKEDRKALFLSQEDLAKSGYKIKFESKFLKPTFYIFGYLFELCTQIRRFFLNFGPILATKDFNMPLILGLLISNISSFYHFRYIQPAKRQRLMECLRNPCFQVINKKMEAVWRLVHAAFLSTGESRQKAKQKILN